MSVILAVLLGAPGAAVAVTSDLQQSIRQNTFEVVMKKPDKDQVTYEKSLPMELMPYIERTDAYRSVGTAFALGHNTYVTAGHVIVSGVNSQFGAPALRRPDGTIFEIDRILKFSADEDFVVFSLRNDPDPKGLEAERAPKIDQQVLAVGNALGEGIVIRDGLFTSETPEQQDGRWKWIRFSAAASPGNSGGPLCNTEGRVIGIVIGKSENENLNYSLPIGRVLDASPSHASFDERRLAGLPLVHGTLTYAFKDEFPLPQSWSAFAQAYSKVSDHHFDESQSRVLASNAATLFPKGTGSLDILYRSNQAGQQARLISESQDGTWTASSPEYQAVDLSQDGKIEVGDYSNVKLIHLVRPAHASDDSFYGDSKAFMDLALKALDIRRPVGPDKVRVTSLGAAISSTVFVDDYGRKWQERIWPVPFFDIYLVAELLPTPEGYHGIAVLAPSLSQHDMRQTSRWLAQHMEVGYSGTLAQWQALLKRKDLLPRSLDEVTLVHKNGWTLNTPRVSSAISADVLPLDERSLLSLDMAFTDEMPKPTLAIKEILWEVDDRRAVGASVWRSVRPPTAAKVDLRNRYDSIAARRVPYDGSMNRESSETFSMTRVLDVTGSTPGTQASDLKYAVTLTVDHFQSPSQLDPRFTGLVQGTKVFEHGTGSVAASPAHAAVEPVAADEPSSTESVSAQQAILDVAQKSVGRDIRGREVSDDMRDFMQSVSTQLAGKPPSDPQKQEFQRHMEWISGYWAVYPALTRNRDMWTEFLRRNSLPDSSQHAERVVDLLAALLVTLSAGLPSEHSAERARQLLHALVDERNRMAKASPVPSTLVLAPRTTPCTAPVTQVSGTGMPVYLTSTSSLEQMWPVTSKRLGEEGTVMVRLSISARGCVQRLAISASSGSDSLDSTVLKFAETMSFKPGSDERGKPVETTVTMPVVFKLTQDGQ